MIIPQQINAKIIIATKIIFTFKGIFLIISCAQPSNQGGKSNDISGCFGKRQRLLRPLLQGLPGVQRKSLREPDAGARRKGRWGHRHPQLREMAGDQGQHGYPDGVQGHRRLPGAFRKTVPVSYICWSRRGGKAPLRGKIHGYGIQ